MSSGYLIEFVRIGAAAKVTAFDPATLAEVSIVGSAHSPDSVLERIAVDKLRKVVERRSTGRK